MKKLVHTVIKILSRGPETNFGKKKALSIVEKYAETHHGILELGCSMGETSLMQGDRFYVGLDLGLEFLEKFNHGKEKSSSHLVNGDATRLPFKDQSFKLIYAISLFELLDEQATRGVLKECLRICRRDSVVVLQFMNSRSLEYLTMGKKHWRGEEKYVYTSLRYGDIHKILDEFGFVINDRVHYLFFPYYLVNKLHWRWLVWLDFRLSSLLPCFATKNLYVLTRRTAGAKVPSTDKG